jgi:hypothetical protein
MCYEVGNLVRYRKHLIDGLWTKEVTSIGHITAVDGRLYKIHDRWIVEEDILIKIPVDLMRPISN